MKTISFFIVTFLTSIFTQAAEFRTIEAMSNARLESLTTELEKIVSGMPLKNEEEMSSYIERQKFSKKQKQSADKMLRQLQHKSSNFQAYDVIAKQVTLKDVQNNAMNIIFGSFIFTQQPVTQIESMSRAIENAIKNERDLELYAVGTSGDEFSTNGLAIIDYKNKQILIIGSSFVIP